MPTLPKPRTPKKKVTKFARNSPDRTEFLLDVATRFFLEKGYGGTSINEMARYAHASKETFYARFPTKKDLFRAVIIRRSHASSVLAAALFSSASTVEETLTRVGQLSLQRLLSDDTIAMQRIIAMESRHFPELPQIFYEHDPRNSLNILAAYLETQVAAGTLYPMDCYLVARQFVGMLVFEYQMRANLGVEPKPTEEEQAYQVKGSVEFFLRAWARPDPPR